MMKPNWDILLKDEGMFPRTLFFEAPNTERFRYGINERLQYCLFFRFPSGPDTRPIDPVIMANLSLAEEIVEGQPTLILTLLNDGLKSLFTDLILSLVDQTIHEPSQISKDRFLILANEWFELFDPSSTALSRYELQGIVAELYFLKFLLENSRLPYNDLLSAWKGPYGKGHDFELDNNLFEIKSRVENRPFVHISSEFQLDFLSGQQLILAVYEFSPDNGLGITVDQLIEAIAIILRSRTGTNMQLYWRALTRLGLSNSQVTAYTAYAFNNVALSFYDCSKADFPSLRNTMLPDDIRNVKYDLNLSQDLNNHVITDIIPFI